MVEYSGEGEGGGEEGVEYEEPVVETVGRCRECSHGGRVGGAGDHDGR